MSKNNSLQKSFIEKYGKDLIFSETDKQRVFSSITNTEHKSKKKFEFTPMFITILAPLLFLLLIVSSTDLGKWWSHEKQTQSTAVKPAPKSDTTAFGDIGIQKVLKQGKFQQINQTVEDKGIAVTVHEAMYDGARIVIVYSMDSKGEPINPFEFNPFQKLFINGKQFLDYSGGGGLTGKKDQYFIEYDLWDELPDQFDLGYELMLSKGEQKRHWNFKIPLQKIEGLNKVAWPDNSVTQKDITLKVEKAMFTPSTTNLKISLTVPQGHELTRNFSKRYVFEVTEQNGTQLASMNSAATSGKGLENGMFMDTFDEFYEPVSKIPKSITIVPYLFEMEQKETVEMPLNKKLPIYLKQDQYSGIKINKVEKYQGELWVYFEVEGPNQSLGLPLNLKEKGTGNEIANVQNPYVKNKKGYIVKFKTSLSPKDLIVTAPKNKYTKLDDLKLKINLKQ